jgi:hypothetical protein
MKRTATHPDPRTELIVRELEAMIASVSGSSVTVTSNNETIVVTTANHTQGDENGVYVDTGGGLRTVYLKPNPTKGDKYKVGNRGAFSLTVNGMGRKINGDPAMVIQYEYSTAQLQYDGTEWCVI